MAKEEQFEIFLELLEKFQAAGILKLVMLIGSWCVPVYRTLFDKTDNFPAIRTLDVDFLIPSAKRLSNDIDTPQILRDLGFVPTRSHMTGLEVYDHPELRVEFLAPEKGRGRTEPLKLPKLHVNAQSLRYLNLLADHPRTVSYKGIRLVVPEPAAFVLQKMIISSRRKTEVKRLKDLETATGVLDHIYLHSKEKSKLESILRKIPSKWLLTIRKQAEKSYPPLLETISGMSSK